MRQSQLKTEASANTVSTDTSGRHSRPERSSTTLPPLESTLPAESLASHTSLLEVFKAHSCRARSFEECMIGSRRVDVVWIAMGSVQSNNGSMLSLNHTAPCKRRKRSTICMLPPVGMTPSQGVVQGCHDRHSIQVSRASFVIVI
jgi:hypothetical protein